MFLMYAELWIALKSWYLWYSEQPVYSDYLRRERCELLSKVDIFDIRNNSAPGVLRKEFVVNCSQKLISLIFGTTKLLNSFYRKWLWIALKSWYLWYSEQQPLTETIGEGSCELLSKVDIFDIRNNSSLYVLNVCGVVNCSQKLISLIFGTTRSVEFKGENELWIALKSWYLWYSEQPLWLYFAGHQSCELLSKVDIFDIRNNLII